MMNFIARPQFRVHQVTHFCVQVNVTSSDVCMWFTSFEPVNWITSFPVWEYTLGWRSVKGQGEIWTCVTISTIIRRETSAASLRTLLFLAACLTACGQVKHLNSYLALCIWAILLIYCTGESTYRFKCFASFHQITWAFIWAAETSKGLCKYIQVYVVFCWLVFFSY